MAKGGGRKGVRAQRQKKVLPPPCPPFRKQNKIKKGLSTKRGLVVHRRKGRGRRIVDPASNFKRILWTD